MTILNKFKLFTSQLNKSAALGSSDSFGGFYDAVGFARMALRLIGNDKYPADLHRDGVLPDGKKVKLISIDEAKSQGASCIAKRKPNLLKQKQETLAKIKEFENQIDQTEDLDKKLELLLVLNDLLQEASVSDLRWQGILKFNNKAIQLLEDRMAIIKFFGNEDGIRWHYGTWGTPVRFFWRNLNGDTQYYKIVTNVDGTRTIKFADNNNI